MAKKQEYEASTQQVSALVPMSIRETVNVIFGGALVGALVIAVYLLLNHFVFGAVLCRPQSVTECGQAPLYSIIVAQVIGVIGGIGLLVRMRIYRPLLVVIATLVSLWTIQPLTGMLPWYGMLIAGMVLFGLSYGLYAWIARIRSFAMALIVTVVLVVIVRISFM